MARDAGPGPLQFGAPGPLLAFRCSEHIGVRFYLGPLRVPSCPLLLFGIRPAHLLAGGDAALVFARHGMFIEPSECNYSYTQRDRLDLPADEMQGKDHCLASTVSL